MRAWQFRSSLRTAAASVTTTAQRLHLHVSLPQTFHSREAVSHEIDQFREARRQQNATVQKVDRAVTHTIDQLAEMDRGGWCAAWIEWRNRAAEQRRSCLLTEHANTSSVYLSGDNSAPLPLAVQESIRSQVLKFSTTAALPSEKTLAVVLRQCPFWLGRCTSAPLVSEVKQSWLSQFPGVVAKRIAGVSSDASAAHLAAPQVFVNVAALTEDHRNALYRQYPFRCEQQHSSEGAPRAAKRRHSYFSAERQQFVYCHARAMHQHFEHRHGGHLVSSFMTWVSIDDVVAHHLQLSATLAVHPDDLVAVEAALQEALSAGKHSVAQLLRRAVDHVVVRPTRIGETLCSFAVPWPPHAQQADGLRSTQSSSVEHYIPFAFCLL